MVGALGGRRAGSEGAPNREDLYRRLTGSCGLLPFTQVPASRSTPQLRLRGLLPILHLPLPLGPPLG